MSFVRGVLYFQERDDRGDVLKSLRLKVSSALLLMIIGTFFILFQNCNNGGFQISSPNISSKVVSNAISETSQPIVYIVSNPPVSTSQNSATFGFVGAQNAIAISTFLCALDSSIFSSCTNPVVFSGLSTGSHEFKVVGVGSNGLPSAPAEFNWTVTPSLSQQPTPVPTPSPLPTPLPMPTPVPTPVSSPGPNPAPAPAPAPTPTPTPTPTPAPAPGAGDVTPFLGGTSKCLDSSGKAKYLFCDDFESGTLAKWDVFSLNQATVDSLQSARGSKAWHIASADRALISPKGLFPLAGPVYYARLFVYFNNLPNLQFSHWSLAFTANGWAAGDWQARIQGSGQGNVHNWSVGSDGSTNFGDWGNADTDSLGRVPTKSWECVEWMMNNQTNEIRVWINNIEQTSLYINPTTSKSFTSTKQSFVLPAANELYIGFTEYISPGATNELWIDEVAINNSKIGCEN